MARKNKKSYLYDSMRKYGIDHFEWQIVDSASTINELNSLETAWANKLKSRGIVLYNNRETGGNKKHSPESIQKMKQVQKLRHETQNVGGWKRIDGGAMLGKLQNRVTCLCCRKETSVNIFPRFHDGKCKESI